MADQIRSSRFIEVESSKTSNYTESAIWSDRFIDRNLGLKNPRKAKSKSDVTNNDASWVTRLNYTMNENKKMTLQNIGQHLTARMIQRASQDNVNRFTGTVLGGFSKDSTPEGYGYFNEGRSNMGDNGILPKTLYNLYTNLISNANEYKEKQSDIGTFSKDSFSISNDFINAYTKQQSGLCMGEANMLNPPFQFNELDDVRSDFRRPKLGRLYSEEIYDFNTPIVYFQPGTVNIDCATIQSMFDATSKVESMATMNGTTSMYQKYLRGDKSLGSRIWNWGKQKVGSFFKNVISFGAKRVIDVVQWYSWTPCIYRYLRFVNEMLEELAVWMGLTSGEYLNTIQEEFDWSSMTHDSITKLSDVAEALKQLVESVWQMGSEVAKTAKGVLGEVKEATEYSNAKPGGYYIAEEERRKGEERLRKSDPTYDTSHGEFEAFPYMGKTDYNWGKLSALRIIPNYKKLHGDFSLNIGKNPDDEINADETLTECEAGNLLIPFAIDKGASASETFSNSTQNHPLADQYNSKYEESNNAHLIGTGFASFGDAAAQATNDLANTGDLVGTAQNVVETVVQTGVKWIAGEINQFVTNTLAEKGLAGEAGMVSSGMGRFILPEVWTDSSFDKSYSISAKFRCPYGHRLFIFENTLVPLIFLIGLTAPRKAGLQMYVTPFYVKMYCKGLFSVPMGMISSLSVTHGESTDRTNDGFFRSISVSISVKDMLPNLAMALDGGVTGVTKAANSGMFNYLVTMGNVDLLDRFALFNELKHAGGVYNLADRYTGYDYMEENPSGSAMPSKFKETYTAKVITASAKVFTNAQPATARYERTAGSYL